MKTIVAFIMAVLVAVTPVAAQMPPNPEVWRTFAQQVEVGSRLKVRLISGDQVTATLVQAAPDQLLVQPVTRVPVPVQGVAYDQIASLERESRSVSGAKAAAIGVASGVGAFFGIMLIFLSIAMD
jgi:hypothetical protein